MSNDKLDAFLASDEGGGPAGQPLCITCRDFAHMDPDIREFLRRKAEGEVHLPVYSDVNKSLWLFLRGVGYTLSGSSLKRHITLCLGVDHKTGAPL